MLVQNDVLSATKSDNYHLQNYTRITPKTYDDSIVFVTKCFPKHFLIVIVIPITALLHLLIIMKCEKSGSESRGHEAVQKTQPDIGKN